MANEYNINIYDEEFTIELDEQGPQGATGPAGPIGPQGPKGDKGDKGKDGTNGAPGPANTLSIGTVVQGSSASATITGAAPNQTLNLVLPKGDKGDRGDVGPQGQQGEQGIPGDRGQQGPTGERGPAGKAATIQIGDVYESDHTWVTNSGTASDVVLDFGLQRGPQGQTGPRGISVTGVEEVSRQGLTSTYRMYFSDGTHFDYPVTDGSVSGITRDNIIELLGFEPASYTSVEEINDLIPNEATTNNKLTDKKYVDDKYDYLDEKVKEIELFKFPNAVIVGEPTIQNGQVSGFSANNYLQFPFVVDLTNRRFQIDFSFTTGDDTATQQNILDSEFGLALAIANGKGLMAISHNGTSWADQAVGNVTIMPRTTYYARLTWNGILYKTELSTDGTAYTSDMTFASTQSPYPRTMYIGASPNIFGPGTAHAFKGTINLNNAFLTIEGQVVWQGMDDAGLATRADVSLSNLDELGEKRFADKANIDDLPKIAKANVPGLVAGGNWLTVNQDTGKMECGELTKAQYDSANGYTFVGKTTLENVLTGKGYAVSSDLATVATSGAYADLTGKPTIPSAVTESTVSGWGFTKNAGTITGIKMNGASKGTSGVVDLGTVITSHQSLDSCVKTSGNQTVAGVKTFTGAPIFKGNAWNNTLAIERDNAGGAYFAFKNSTGYVGGLGFSPDRPVILDSNGTNAKNIITNSTFNTAVGSSTQPVYINSNGVATACTNSIPSTYLKTTYINGTSGYNIWSNGYCEQWGTVTTNGGNDNGKTVSFLKTFKDTNYIVSWDFLGTATSGQQAANWLGTAFTQSRAVNSMNVSIGGYNYYAYLTSARWIVRGYLASGQY